MVEEVNYSFKTADYYAHITSPSSIDTYFSVTISMLGQVKYDTYDSVLSGWNTYQRIDSEYRKLVDAVFSSSEFPLVSEIDFGEIEMLEKDAGNSFDGAIYRIKLSDLELDKQYDVKKLAKTSGHIVFYAQDDEISFQRASEVLLLLKETLDEAGVPFYAIDFVLEKPRNEDGSASADSTTISIENYLYSDIYEDGLVDRLKKAHNALMEYYAEQDAKKS